MTRACPAYRSGQTREPWVQAITEIADFDSSCGR